MLDLLRRCWRFLCLDVECQADILERLEKAENRLYALQEDYKRLLATVRKLSMKDV